MKEVVVYYPMRILPWSALSANDQPAKHPIHVDDDGALMALDDGSPQGFIPVYATWEEVRQIYGHAVQIGKFTTLQGATGDAAQTVEATSGLGI